MAEKCFGSKSACKKSIELKRYPIDKSVIWTKEGMEYNGRVIIPSYIRRVYVRVRVSVTNKGNQF